MNLTIVVEVIDAAAAAALLQSIYALTLSPKEPIICPAGC